MFRSTFKSLHNNIFKLKINHFSNNPQKKALDNIKKISSIHLEPNYKIPSPEPYYYIKNNKLNITWSKDTYFGIYHLRYLSKSTNYKWKEVDSFDSNEYLQIFHSLYIIDTPIYYMFQVRVQYGDFKSEWSPLKIVK